MQAEERRVRVELADRSYDILIAERLLERAGVVISPLLLRPRVFVVADARVRALHGAALERGLTAAGVAAIWVEVPPGEGSKSFARLEAVLDALIGAGAERSDLLAAFGGGVVGDLAGLAAALMKRGARFVQIPTTLLAQVDSSVGGKTAINTAAGKNLAGVFHQPALVLADLSVLATLPARERAAGLAEVAKYALIDDPGFFAWLEAEADALRAGDPAALAHAVEISCRAKARVVSADETEQGDRALLNLGHTFAHALERTNGYDEVLLHGEAVGCGLALAMRFSQTLGLAPPEDADRTERLLARLGLTADIGALAGGPYRADELTAHMAHDKKTAGGRLTFILSRGIGRAFIARDVARDAVAAFLEGRIARAPSSSGGPA